MQAIFDAKGLAKLKGCPDAVESWDGTKPLRLGPLYALKADRLQWIVLKARNHKGCIKWQPVSYVGSNTAVLRRVLREEGAELSPEGERALNALPETFRQWREAVR